MQHRASFLCIGLLSAPLFCWAAESSSDSGESRLGVFVGVGEQDTHESTHSAKVVGLVYEYEFANNWDIGGVVERLDVHDHTSTVALFSAGYSFTNGIRLFGGPGYEFKSHPPEDEWLFRTGISYKIHLNDKWLLAPEFYVDAVGARDNVWVIGLNLGYGL